MRTYILYVRQFSVYGSYKVKCYKVTTDNIYRIIGKMYCTEDCKIDRIDYDTWSQEKEDSLRKKHVSLRIYVEPKCVYD